MGRRIMWLALLAVLLCSGAQAQGVYTPAWAITFTDEANRLLFVRHATRDDLGYLVTFNKAAGSNIHPIYTIEEGTLSPAWYPAYAPDVISGVASSAGSFNTKLYGFLNDAHYADWNVPASANGLDRLAVFVVEVVGASRLEIVRNPAGAAEVLGTVTTAGAGTVYRVEKTVNLVSPLATGDVIRIRRLAGETTNARLNGWYAYHSTQTPTATQTAVAMPGVKTAVHGAGSSVEFAYAMAPQGSAVQYTGGWAHQGGAGNNSEVSPTEAWTKDGAAWPAATGYHAGTFTLRRQSTVYYDAGNQNIAALDYTFHFEPRRIRCEHTVTAAVNLTVGELTMYVAMLASHAGTDTFWIQPPTFSGIGPGHMWSRTEGAELDATADDDSFIEAPARFNLNGIQQVRASSTAAGQTLVIRLGTRSHPIVRGTVWQRVDYNKWYWALNLGTAQTAGATWGGSWWWYVDTPPRVEDAPVVLGGPSGLR
jgi:hypothetical protein